MRGRAHGTLVSAAATALAAAGILLLHACGGDDGPTEPREVPGVVGVRLIRPAAGTDAGVLLELHGPGIDSVRIPAAVDGPPLRLFDGGPGPSPRRVIVAGGVAGGVTGGRILEFHVPDVRDLSAYRVELVEAAASGSYVLRSLAGYEITLVPPPS